MKCEIVIEKLRTSDNLRTRSEVLAYRNEVADCLAELVRRINDLEKELDDATSVDRRG